MVLREAGVREVKQALMDDFTCSTMRWRVGIDGLQYVWCTGRAGWGGSAAGKQHQKMDLQSGASKPGLGFFKPRAVAVSNTEEHHPARTNDEFRKMMLAKKKGPAGGNAGQGAGASDSK